MVIIFALMAVAVYKIKSEGKEAQNKNEDFNANTIALMRERNEQEKQTQLILAQINVTLATGETFHGGWSPAKQIAEHLCTITELFRNRS